MPYRLRSIIIDRCACIRRLTRWRREQAMRKALSRLSPFHQEVFRLIRFDGLTTEAASRELSVEPHKVHEALVDVVLALGRANR